MVRVRDKIHEEFQKQKYISITELGVRKATIEHLTETIKRNGKATANDDA